MNRSTSPVFTFHPYGILVLLVFLAACGGSSKHADDGDAAKGASVFTDTPGAKTLIGSRLHVRIVPGLADHPEFPDLRAEPVADSNQAADPDGYNPVPTAPVTVSGNTVTFNRAIQTLDRDRSTARSLFIVLDEFLENERISQVFHSHVSVDPSHTIAYASDRKAALKDDVDRVWYIPLTSALDGEKPEDADASQDHTVTLDLSFQSRGGTQVHLKIRVQGNLPHVGVQTSFTEAANDETPLDSRDFLASFSQPATYPGRLRFENPSNRKLKLWIWNSHAMELQGKIVATLSDQKENQPPISSDVSKMALVPLEVNGLRVTHSGGGRSSKAEELPFTPGVWTVLSILPREAVEVAWMLIPSNQRACRLPADQVKNYSWDEWTTEYSSGAHEGIDWGHRVKHPHSKQLTDTWKVAAARLVGGLAIEAWASDETLSSSELAADRSRFYAAGKKLASLALGDRLRPLLTLKPGTEENDEDTPDSVHLDPIPADLLGLGDLGDTSTLPLFCKGLYLK